MYLYAHKSSQYGGIKWWLAFETLHLIFVLAKTNSVQVTEKQRLQSVRSRNIKGHCKQAYTLSGWKTLVTTSWMQFSVINTLVTTNKGTDEVKEWMVFPFQIWDSFSKIFPKVGFVSFFSSTWLSFALTLLISQLLFTSQVSCQNVALMQKEDWNDIMLPIACHMMQPPTSFPKGSINPWRKLLTTSYTARTKGGWRRLLGWAISMASTLADGITAS